MLRKMDVCLHLNEEYQICFRRTKARLEEAPNERPFEFSEMYIFGKFNAFSVRLTKLKELFGTIQSYQTLGLTRIEGVDPLNGRFQLAVCNLKKRPYDLLDSRKTEFDADYEEFKRQVQDVETGLQQLMTASFEGITSTQRALSQLERFERLQVCCYSPGLSGINPVCPQLSCLNIHGQYELLLLQYAKNDLTYAQTLYNTHRHNPPIDRDMPPVTGKISWARKLHDYISTPMNTFSQVPDLIGT